MIVFFNILQVMIGYIVVGALWVLYGTFGIPVDQCGRKIRYTNKRGIKGLINSILQWPLTMRMIFKTILRNYDHLEED